MQAEERPHRHLLCYFFIEKSIILSTYLSLPNRNRLQASLYATYSIYSSTRGVSASHQQVERS